MANEGGYRYASPGGVLAPSPQAMHLKRYKAPEEISRMDDYVTFGDAIDIVRDNAVLFIAGGLALGLGWACWNGKL